MVSQRSMDTSNGSMMLCGCLPRPRNKARSCAHRHATMTTGATAWHDANGATDRDARLAHVTTAAPQGALGRQGPGSLKLALLVLRAPSTK